MTALKSDTLFPIAGLFRLRLGRDNKTVWERARWLNVEIRREVGKCMAAMQNMYQLSELIRLPSPGQLHSFARFCAPLRRHGYGRLAISNLGELEFVGADSPLKVLNMRGHTYRGEGLLMYVMHGQIYFHFESTEQYMNQAEVEMLKREIMGVLQQCVEQETGASKITKVSERTAEIS